MNLLAEIGRTHENSMVQETQWVRFRCGMRPRPRASHLMKLATLMTESRVMSAACPHDRCGAETGRGPLRVAGLVKTTAAIDRAAPWEP